MDPTSRLRIATRIHFALLRHMGAGIDVGYMLKRADYAREVLYVCEGSGDAELFALMRKFEHASLEEQAATRPVKLDTVTAPLESGWPGTTTSFGASTFADTDAERAKPAPSRGLTSSHWFGPYASPSKH
jgi:hypothetical protein